MVSALTTVSFRFPSGVLLLENMTYGGSKVRLLNCEYGAKLSFPWGERVEIQPIGRGTTQAFCVFFP